MNANVGMYVAPSDVMLEIIETDHLHFRIECIRKDILKVKVDQDINFTCQKLQKKCSTLKYIWVGKSIEGNDRTINVHGHLDDNMKQRLITGMFVSSYCRRF
jgi:cobalt-zinc-cadmium efflux system membrane fusion protein